MIFNPCRKLPVDLAEPTNVHGYLANIRGNPKVGYDADVLSFSGDRIAVALNYCDGNGWHIFPLTL